MGEFSNRSKKVVMKSIPKSKYVEHRGAPMSQKAYEKKRNYLGALLTADYIQLTESDIDDSIGGIQEVQLEIINAYQRCIDVARSLDALRMTPGDLDINLMDILRNDLRIAKEQLRSAVDGFKHRDREMPNLRIQDRLVQGIDPKDI